MIFNEIHERSAHKAVVMEVGVGIATRQLQLRKLQLIELRVTPERSESTISATFRLAGFSSNAG